MRPEAVLEMGSDPLVGLSALGIVTVCKFYVQSPLPCVSGVDRLRSLNAEGESLIMLNRTAEKMTAGRKLLRCRRSARWRLRRPCSLACSTPRRSGRRNRTSRCLQLIATSSLPKFDVASIKPSAADSSLKVDFAPGGKLYVANATLRFLIKIAYDIGDDQIASGPGWIGSKRFDLAATPERPLGGDPKDMAPDQILAFHKPTRLRLQRLLADRFQLELRRESAAMPIFALVLAKGGPKNLTPTQGTGDPQLNGKSGSGTLRAAGVDMNTLAHFLSEGQTGRPVVDMTGLQGKFDFRLEWAPDANLNPLPADPSANPQPADVGGVSIFTAVQQQLGLKLEARIAAADRLMVVRAELPSAN